MAITLADGNVVDVVSEKRSFWELINQYNVKVPELQRDYAYGRDIKRDSVKADKKNSSGDESTKIIRENLIQGAKDALDGVSRLDLNFIYGAKHQGGEYSPIDGQQRLTTLFLLYWYVFQRAKDNASMQVLKQSFSYATRDTSERFCSLICQDLSIDFALDEIADQIADCSWFAENFEKDPTVWSMMVVIDSIHSTFKNSSDSEISTYASKLKASSCAINVEALTVTSLGNEEDLYIKMNGRGKQLSDFEIFKSLLQKSDELRIILGGTPSLLDISKFIGRFNTDYSGLFNSLIGEPLSVENALFAYFRNYMMCNYFAQVSSDGVREEQYRLDCGKFRYFNGKVLFEFFSNPDYFRYYNKLGKSCPADVNIRCLKKAERVLSRMFTYHLTNGTADVDSKYFDIRDRIDGLVRTRPMYADFIDYAMFEFVAKFDYPKTQDEKNGLLTWKRFIYNIASNIDLKGSNESLIKVIRVINDMLSGIGAYSENGVLQSIKNANSNPLLTNVMLMKPQFDEESIKANLVLADSSWKNTLIEAEDYYKGGQIGFLLYMACDSSGAYDRTVFTRLLNASKKVWTVEKNLHSTVDGRKIAKALLCVIDNTTRQTAQLIQKNSDTFAFPLLNYGDVLQNYTDKNKKDRCAQWEILKTLLEKISSGMEAVAAAEDIIKNKGVLPYWKECFVNNELFECELGNGVKFSNHIYFIENDLLLLSKQSVRSKNMSLRTLMLYNEMLTAGYRGVLNPYPTQEILDDKGNPHRTIEFKGKNIGYDNIQLDYIIIEDGTKKKTRPEIMTEISKL